MKQTYVQSVNGRDDGVFVYACSQMINVHCIMIGK